MESKDKNMLLFILPVQILRKGFCVTCGTWQSRETNTRARKTERL